METRVRATASDASSDPSAVDSKLEAIGGDGSELRKLSGGRPAAVRGLEGFSPLMPLVIDFDTLTDEL